MIAVIVIEIVATDVAASTIAIAGMKRMVRSMKPNARQQLPPGTRRTSPRSVTGIVTRAMNTIASEVGQRIAELPERTVVANERAIDGCARKRETVPNATVERIDVKVS